MSAPTARLPQQSARTAPAQGFRDAALSAVDAVRRVDGAWRHGYGVGYRHGHHDGVQDREADILGAAAQAVHAVGSTPTAGDVATARERVDRDDAAWDAYSTDGDGQPVWDDEARSALIAWCLADWGEAG